MPVGLTLSLVGCGNSGNSADRDLEDRAFAAIDQCLNDAGFDDPQEEFSEEEIAQGNAEYQALQSCKDDVFARPEFIPLDLNYEEQSYEEWVAESWAVWKCLEEAGYARLTPIPLMFEGGRPIRPIVTNFNVAVDSQDEVAAFYETAAACGDGDIEAYKIQGRFLGTVDGEFVGCLEDNIGRPGFDDVTGCFNVDEYPAGV